MKTLKLKVTLTCWRAPVWRIIEIGEDQTLEDLHMGIQRAFGWYNDHLYSFFMDGNPRNHSSEYTAPYEVPEGVPTTEEAVLKDLNLSVGKKFLYIYDFGDNLDHEIEVLGEGKTKVPVSYPQLVEAYGLPPEQYEIRRGDLKEEEDHGEHEESSEEFEPFDDCPICQALKSGEIKANRVVQEGDFRVDSLDEKEAKKLKKLMDKHRKVVGGNGKS